MSPKRPYRFPFAKYPAIRLALLLILGILLSSRIPLGQYVWGGLFALMILCYALAEYTFAKTLRPYFSYAAVGLYLVGVICFGGFWHSFYDQQKMPASARLLAAYTWKSVGITGTIQNIKQTSSGKYQLDVRADRTVLEDSLLWHESYTVRAVYDPQEHRMPNEMQPGATIHFTATVYPLQAKHNPNDFNYKKYLASQNIYVQAGITHISGVHTRGNWLGWSWWRRHALALIEHNFSPKTVAIAKALLLGYKNDLPRDEKIAFSRAGLSHIMAVSGLHVGFIIAPFWLIIPLFWTFKRGREIGLCIFCVLLWFYAGLTGFPASVVRASLTGGLLTYGRLFHKSRSSKNLTAVAAIIILLVNPNQLFDIGFQLSFAAVYIILLILPVLQRFIPQKIQHRWYGIPVSVMLVSFVVQFGLYPLLSYYFGEFSLVGPLANAIIIPWLALIIPYALTLLVVAAFLPATGFVMNAPCRWFLHFLHWFVNMAVSWDWSWVQSAKPGPLLFLIWLAVLLLMASAPFSKIRWKAAILLLVLLCVQQGRGVYQSFKTPALKITLFDVGQGDATLVSTPAGKHFLIDTGRWTPTYNSARYVIIPHLKALGVQKLEAVFLSHPHADHIGGLPELIKHMQIDTIYNSGQSYDSDLYRRYHRLARAHGIPVKPLHAGMRVSPDPALQILIYGPSLRNHYADVNEHSLVMELIYGKTQFLFMGDAGRDEERLLQKNYAAMLHTNFLKVGHHGSRTSSSSSFLKMATPAYSAVSLGLHNRFHHPNVAAIRRLKQAHTKLYFTSLKGALEFTSNGDRIKYNPWH